MGGKEFRNERNGFGGAAAVYYRDRVYMIQRVLYRATAAGRVVKTHLLFNVGEALFAQDTSVLVVFVRLLGVHVHVAVPVNGTQRVLRRDHCKTTSKTRGPSVKCINSFYNNNYHIINSIIVRVYASPRQSSSS